MRIISGKAKGLKLKPVPGDSTRPILDRAKENLFNILNPLIPGTRWCDLFAGTGQIGLEALSRGAAEVVFTDSAKMAVKTIQENIQHTKLTNGATVLQTEALAYLQTQKNRQPHFDFIYVAPPQYKKIWSQALLIIDEHAGTLLAEEGQVVVQIDPSEYEELTLKQLELTDKRAYGRTMFCFYTFVGQG